MDLIEEKGTDPCASDAVREPSFCTFDCYSVLCFCQNNHNYITGMCSHIIMFFLQQGSQAIHLSAAVGHLDLLKTLVEKYNVPPSIANNVRHMQQQLLFPCKVLFTLHMESILYDLSYWDLV